MLPAGFVNSAALNVYHDGSEGIQSHFDDAARFERPVVSLRLFSDSRLSFGTQLYGCASPVTQRTKFRNFNVELRSNFRLAPFVPTPEGQAHSSAVAL